MAVHLSGKKIKRMLLISIKRYEEKNNFADLGFTLKNNFLGDNSFWISQG